jgi:hypothetical protein
MKERARRGNLRHCAVDNNVIGLEQFNLVPGTAQHLKFRAHNGIFATRELISVMSDDNAQCAEPWVQRALFPERRGTKLGEVVAAQHLLGPATQPSHRLQTKKGSIAELWRLKSGRER